MELDKDFKEFLDLLISHKVEYLVVGGYSVAFHGFVRYTGDLDIWINPTEQNGKKTKKVLVDFGFSSLNIEIQDLIETGQVIQLGVEPLRIDILTSITGVESFDKAFAQKESLRISGIDLNYIGYEDLIANKKKAARLQDQRDVKELAKIKMKKKRS